jgi:endonuclease/exonuclease/phosphatase family metal-dependent hydrolase
VSSASQLSRSVETGSPSDLEHDLTRFFPKFTQYPSSTDLKRSRLYQELKGEIDRVLNSVVQEDFAPGCSLAQPWVRVTAWNIERGIHLEKIIRVLKHHPVISRSDAFLLTELDYGMARSENRFIAREIASALGFNYVFVPCYINLNKGSGLESEAPGENTHALHGNALFSRHPIRQAASIVLPNGKDKMKGKEKRLGNQRAVFGIVEHPLGSIRMVSLHLDAHSSQRHRMLQMSTILDFLDHASPSYPVVLGGDWNTSTYNSRRALYAILGYWRRVLMGVRYVCKNHYPHPDRWFERGLFRELERRGYRYRDLNELGACTLHYDVRDLALNRNMGEWIPGWCFPFINWALSRNAGSEGRCSLKLDWFAGRQISPEPEHPPRVLADVRSLEGGISDHDPIVVDFLPVN